MKYLTFARSSECVRNAAFEERSLLPVSAACIVANAMREHLSQCCGASVDLRLWPPAIPQPEAWRAILRDAQLYVFRGTLCDAALVLRRDDAQALAGLLFGERTAGEPHDLSALESEITRRAVARVAAALPPVCGDGRFDPQARQCAFVTYFELHVIEPLPLCIGVALSREPAPAHTTALSLERLMDARLGAYAEIALAPMRAREIVALAVGSVLERSLGSALLRVGGRVIARGSCGVRARRYAFEVEARA
jgi:flagellar motor switch/type III secretory pathway protein FliN